MTFPLSDQPVLGEWFIFVEMQGHVYNRSFEVQKYGKLENLRLLRFQTWGIHSPSDDTDNKEEKTAGASFTGGSVGAGVKGKARPLSCLFTCYLSVAVLGLPCCTRALLWLG